MEEGTDAVLTGEAFADHLRIMARFHSYSAGNIALIGWQRPEASRVAGYRKWMELGRQVGKGEKAIEILVPHAQVGALLRTPAALRTTPLQGAPGIGR